MDVDLWADVVCSWCGIAQRRLRTALDRFPQAEHLRVRHHSFLLLANESVGRSWQFEAYMQERRGLTAAAAAQSASQIEQVATGDGHRAYHVLGNHIGNSSLAHEFAAHATAQGRHAEAWSVLFNAYFADQAPLWDADDFADLARRVGIDPDAAVAAVRHRRHRREVEEDHTAAVTLGAQGVPFLVIDGRYGLSGAQPVDVIVDALHRAWNERAEDQA